MNSASCNQMTTSCKRAGPIAFRFTPLYNVPDELTITQFVASVILYAPLFLIWVLIQAF